MSHPTPQGDSSVGPSGFSEGSHRLAKPVVVTGAWVSPQCRSHALSPEVSLYEERDSVGP